MKAGLLASVAAVCLGLPAIAHAFPLGGTGTASTDAMVTVAAATAAGAWTDVSVTFPTKSTLNSVGYVCSSSCPPGGTGPTAANIAGGGGGEHFETEITKWGGAALNTDDRKLIIWGGGHTDYFGNEAYAWSLATGQWEQLTAPSANTGGNTTCGTLPDGRPNSEHTYDSLGYIPGSHKLTTTLGMGSNGFVCSLTYELDLSTASPNSFGPWTLIANNAPIPAGQTVDFGPVFAYDSTSGHGFAVNHLRAALDEYDPTQAPASRWSHLGTSDGPDNFEITGAIQPGVRLITYGNGGRLTEFLISGVNKGQVTQITPTGDTSCGSVEGPGLVWYAAGNVFAIYCGGQKIITYDPVSHVMTGHAMSGGGTPPAAQANGTYGRFQFDTLSGLFFTVAAEGSGTWAGKPNF